MPKLSSKHMDGNYLIKCAKKGGLEVVYGKGDHVKIIGGPGRGYNIVPARPIGRGLACSIVKWLIAAGITVSVVLFIYGGYCG